MGPFFSLRVFSYLGRGQAKSPRSRTILLFCLAGLKGHGLAFWAYQGMELSEPSLFEEARQKGCALGVKGEPKVDNSVSNHSPLKTEAGDSVRLVTQTSDRHECETSLKEGIIILGLRLFLQTSL